MTIIEILAREDGSHNIQSRHGAARVWEDGYIEVPSHLEAAVWATCGWCDLHIEEGRLVGVTPTELEEALAQTDETAIALFESQAEQESINAQQDDALLDIYEMLGG
jgi:AhpD family alkylhydroperoxidase